MFKNFKIFTLFALAIFLISCSSCQEEELIIPYEIVNPGQDPDSTNTDSEFRVTVTEANIDGQEGLIVYAGLDFDWLEHESATAFRACGSDVVPYSVAVPFYRSDEYISATSVNEIRLNDKQVDKTDGGFVKYWSNEETKVEFLSDIAKRIIQAEPGVRAVQYEITKGTDDYFQLFEFMVVTDKDFAWNVNELKVGVPIYGSSADNVICYRWQL